MPWPTRDTVGELLPSTWTVEDLEHLPEGDGIRHEIIDGELVMSAAPATEHQRVAGRLFVLLYRALVETGLGEVFNAPFDVELSRSSCVEPDLVVIRTEHADRLTEKRLVGAPDLVIEILSPGTAARDLVTKLKLYARHGVPHYWVIDPERRELLEYTLEGDAYRHGCTVQEAETFMPRGFPELSLPLAALFRPPAAR